MTIDGYKRSAVQAGFHLSENSGQLFKGEFHSPNNLSQMCLGTFDCRLPQSTKVRRVLWYKLPLNVPSDTKLGYVALSDLTLQELIKLAISTNEISSMIASQ